MEPGSKIEFGRVLALKSGDKFEVGKPYLEGALPPRLLRLNGATLKWGSLSLHGGDWCPQRGELYLWELCSLAA